ncbi:MAG: tetratricopeptide repeat protein [Planctomycetaceae bacterium]
MLIRTILIFAMTCTLTFGTLYAQDPQKSPELSPIPASDVAAPAAWIPMIVVTDNAEVFHGDVSVRKLLPGSIVHISKTNDPWLLVPQYDAWLDKKHVLSLPAAEETCTNLLEKQQNFTLYHHRAIVRSEMGRFDDALADFAEALKLDEKSSAAHINRGITWMRKGNLDKAKEDLTQAIKLNPKDARGYFNRGMLHALAGDDNKALDDATACIKLDPKFAEAYNDRGQIFSRQGKLDEALKDFNEAIAIRKKFPAALENRALVKETKGDFPGAIADFAESIVLFPDSVGALNDLALLLATCPDANIRNPKNAVAYAQRACELTEQKDANCLDTLAIAQAANDDFPTAIKTAESALKIAEGSVKAEIEAHLKLFRDNTKVPHFNETAPPTN